MSIVDVGFAEILYEWNNLEAASLHIQRGLEFIPLWSKADDIALAHVIHSKIQWAQRNIPAAGKIIEKGSQVIYSSGVFSEARDAVITAKVNLWLKQEDRLAINRWVRSIENRLSSDQPYRFENELALITLARVYIAQNNFDEGIELLSRLEASAQSGGRDGRFMKILILQALVMDRKGDPGRAFSILERVLSLAAPAGYVRTFIDEGQPMQVLLSQWLSNSEKNPLKDYARQLVAQFNDKSLSVNDEQGRFDFKDVLIEPLSPRELEVLSLIALGKTNKEISVELVVSPGTVKAHTSSIYRKLDVANRTGAVARARELDILS
jgi:LuxR family maltose regulon positive regulatory protein